MTTAPKPTYSSILTDFKKLYKLWPYLRANKKLILIAITFIPIISALQMSLPLILRQAIDEGIVKHDQAILTISATLFLGAILLEYLFRAGQSLLTALAVHRMIKKLRNKIIKHILHLKPAFHDKSMSGALVTRATSDFDNLSESLNQGVLTAVVDLSVLVGCVVGMFLLDWQLAIIATVLLPVIGALVAGFSKALKRAMLKARRKIATLNAFTQECLYGNSTIKLLAAEKSATKKYETLNIDYRNAQMSSVMLDALMFAVLDGIASITVGIILWFVASQFFGASILSAGIIVAFVQYVQQLFEPLKHLGNKMAMLQGAFTSIERIFGILDRDEKITGDTTYTKLQGHVKFKNVSFAYPGQKELQKVLHGIDINLPTGQSLALVGATGSGKSTIVKLLTKLYDGFSGEILLDGKNLVDLNPDALRHQIAIVPQDIVLFAGTIEFNISLNQRHISLSDVKKAAELVGADRFIEDLPSGYQFVIREQGGNLSQGQRQLIAFARALAKQPALVILDEATSSIDPKSEVLIQAAIDKILHGRSVIVIAHRLSTIKKCDQIIVLDHGHIKEQGNHPTLLAKKGRYFQLHQAFA